MSYNGLPYDEFNDSELYSAESHTERWSGKTHEDDDYQTFEERMIEEYQQNPNAFSDKRDEIYCFGYVPSGTKRVHDKWTLIDGERGIVCTIFDTEEQLKGFLVPRRVRRAIKRIIMDRIVEFNPDKSRCFMMDKCLNTRTIWLIKDCVCANPLNLGVDFFDDERMDTPVAWNIENITISRENELCIELYNAGIENERTMAAVRSEYPF